MEDYGWLSLLPPLLTIFLAIVSRNVILALVLGGLSGALIVGGFHPLDSVLYFVGDKIFGQISQPANNQVIITLGVIGGFIKLIEDSGGAKAFAKYMTKFVSTPIKAQLMTYFCGLGIFFTDSGNSLIIGPLFAPLYDKLGICKEKLAYLLDSTASPVCILVPFISWGAYIMSLIESSYSNMGIEGNPLNVLLSALPFQLYSLLTLVAVPMIIFFAKDFGPMAKAQADFEKVIPKEIQKSGDEDEGSLWAIGLPLFTLIGFLSFMMIYFYNFTNKGLTSTSIRTSLFVSYGLAALSSALYMKKSMQKSFGDSVNSFVDGGKSVFFIFYILILAWTLSSICKDLGTGPYIAMAIKSFVTPTIFPMIVFLLGALISLALGSSYGTFAILMPIALPVALDMDVSLYVTIGAVLSGGLFGDHTSPISDTTVLASVGAGCDHIKHVSTQLVYSCVTAFVSAICFVIAAVTQSPYVVFLGVILLFGTLLFITRRYGKVFSA